MELDVYKDWLGIPEGQRPPNHYELLRLQLFDDSTDKVRANYKKLNAHIRKYATGQYSVRSQELLNELARAMLCLTDPERKRDYDESLGREFPEDEAGSVPLERILVKQGHIDRDQMRDLLQHAESHGLSVRDAVVQMKLVSASVATQAMAEELRIPYVDLDDMAPEYLLLRKIPQQLCKRNTILPMFIDDGFLLLACAEDISHELDEELRLRFGHPVRRMLATPKSIQSGIKRYFEEMESMIAAAEAAGTPIAEPSRSSSSSSEAAKKPADTRRFSQLSREEQDQRKAYGKLIMTWSVIGSVLFDQFVVKSLIPALNSGLLANLPSLTTIFLAPIAIFWVLKVYWK